MRFANRSASSVVVSAPAMALRLPATASATSHGVTNHREVPNDACDLDTPVADFPDRDAASEAHRRSTDCITELDIAQGRDGEYQPGVHVTRDQMASLLLRTASRNHTGQFDSYQPGGQDDSFTDVTGTHADTMRTGYELWLFEGRVPGEFGPQADVRREEMATFLTRVLDLVHPGASHPLFPCAEVDTDRPATFTDGNFDWVADGIASTGNGHACISKINGEPTEGPVTVERNVAPQDGQIDVTVVSPTGQADGTVAMVFDDRGPVDELRLDLGNRPANAFGFEIASWE